MFQRNLFRRGPSSSYPQSVGGERRSRGVDGCKWGVIRVSVTMKEAHHTVSIRARIFGQVNIGDAREESGRGG